MKNKSTTETVSETPESSQIPVISTTPASESREQTGHTPGPWRISDNGLAIIGRSHSDTVIFSSDGNSMINGEANARLIAAAPELLEACKRLQVRIFMLDGSENEEYRLARAAIAKAESRLVSS